MNCYSTWGAQF